MEDGKAENKECWELQLLLTKRWKTDVPVQTQVSDITTNSEQFKFPVRARIMLDTTYNSE